MLRGHGSVVRYSSDYFADPKVAINRSYDVRGSRDIIPIQAGALNDQLPRTSWPSLCSLLGCLTLRTTGYLGMQVLATCGEVMVLGQAQSQEGPSDLVAPIKELSVTSLTRRCAGG